VTLEPLGTALDLLTIKLLDDPDLVVLVDEFEHTPVLTVFPEGPGKGDTLLVGAEVGGDFLQFQPAHILRDIEDRYLPLTLAELGLLVGVFALALAVTLTVTLSIVVIALAVALTITVPISLSALSALAGGELDFDGAAPLSLTIHLFLLLFLVLLVVKVELALHAFLPFVDEDPSDPAEFSELLLELRFPDVVG